MPRPSDLPPLSDAQLEIMNVVWDQGEVSVGDTWSVLSEQRSIARNTVQTVLTILKGKGVVAARKGQGRAHLYLTKASQEEVAASMVHDLTERLYDGRIAPVLLHLVESETLSPSARAELKSWIEEHLDDEEDAE